MKKRREFLVLIVAGLLASCHATPPPADSGARIIFDTDMGSDCDDAGALALLHAYADLGKAEILACIYSSGAVPYGAGVVEAINIRYGRPHIPVGACQDLDFGDPVDKMGAGKLARDTAAFGNRIIHNSDAEEQTALNRRILAAQPDGSVDYVTVGHTRGLYDLLISGPDQVSPLKGTDLAARKIRRWIALGALGARNPEGHRAKDWNFFFNGSAPYTLYCIGHFPGDIYFVDAGSEVMTGKSLKTTPPGNIVRTAYRDWLWWYGEKTLDDQRPSWDLATVLYAVEDSGEFLEQPESGRLDFDPEEGCIWHTGAQNTRQYYVREREGIQAGFAEYLNGMISRAPLLNITKRRP
jgi:hypothetical protein